MVTIMDNGALCVHDILLGGSMCVVVVVVVICHTAKHQPQAIRNTHTHTGTGDFWPLNSFNIIASAFGTTKTIRFVPKTAIRCEDGDDGVDGPILTLVKARFEPFMKMCLASKSSAMR